VRVLSYALVAIAVTDCAAFAQPPAPRQPPASSRRVEGRDGDLVVVTGDDRVAFMRRREANVRAVWDASRQSLLLLADFGSATSGPDGLVDMAYRFSGLSGEWPLGARWDGTATIDEYWIGDGGRRSMVVSTPAGVFELTSPPPAQIDFLRIEPSPTAVLTYRGGTNGPVRGVGFDEAERRQNDPAVQAQMPRAVIGGVTGSANLAGGLVVSPPPPPQGTPLRVGGNIKPPTKLFDVKPVYPQTARAAGVTGNVIVEITIAADGAVADARILRSIPLLDEAALQAVRQWRYDVTLLNGVPVPLTMIVTVPFGM
jgi:TonB family protein